MTSGLCGSLAALYADGQHCRPAPLSKTPRVGPTGFVVLVSPVLSLPFTKFLPNPPFHVPDLSLLPLKLSALFTTRTTAKQRTPPGLSTLVEHRCQEQACAKVQRMRRWGKG